MKNINNISKILFTAAGLSLMFCGASFADDAVVKLPLAEEKAATYGRGAGHISEKICAEKNNSACEKHGLLYYPKCKDGYVAVGCCICSPK